MQELRTLKLSTVVVHVIIFFVLSCLVMPLAFSDCSVDIYEWVAGEGTWLEPDNWRHEEWDPFSAQCVGQPGVPYLSSNVLIQNGGTSIVNGTSVAGSVNVWTGSGLRIIGGRLDCATDLSIQNSSELQIAGGHLDCADEMYIDFDSCGEQTGGTLAVGSLLLGGWGAGWYGQFTHRGGTLRCTTHLSIGGLWISNGADGTYLLEGTAQLSAGSIEIARGYKCSGILEQSGGQVITDFIEIAGGADSTGTWRLMDGSIDANNVYIGMTGAGNFIQAGGTVNISNSVIIAYQPESSGSYELNEGVLQSQRIHVGMLGAGNFIQTGGIVDGNDEVIIAKEPNSIGTYEISNGVLHTEDLDIGMGGTGRFVQTGGIVGIWDSMIGYEPNSNGTYELSGAELNVAGHIDIGRGGGSGSLVVDNGTINGIIYGPWDGSAISVHPTGSLTGPGTFNLFVEYCSEEIYGTNHNENVAIVFEPNCLTEGGDWSIEQITPDDFYSGYWPGLLESSVFDVNFYGSYCGEFFLAIPYDQDEVNEVGVSEFDLGVFHQISPTLYEMVPVIFIDPNEDIIFVDCKSFGKFAVGIHNGGGGGGFCCPKWYEGNLDRDCDIDLNDLKLLTDYWLEDEAFVDIWPYSDNPPMWGDGIINFLDFAVLAGNWPKYGCN